MKKAKKLLSLFLAALMLMSCFGAIGASALTNEEATAAVTEFNASIPDHSDVYANMSAKQWSTTMKSLDATLSTVLKLANVKNTIYSDSTVSSIVTALCKAIAPDTMLVGITPQKMADSLTKAAVYPEVAAYLATVEDWADVDASKLVWGITPGDEDAFITALSYAFAPNIGSVINLLTGIGSFMGNAGQKAFNNALIPLIEALHQGPFMDFDSFKKAGSNNGQASLAMLLKPICGAINSFLASPISYLCEILPELVYTYPQARAGLNISVAGQNLGALLLPLLPEDIDGILKMVMDALGLKLNLAPIDERYLYTMGAAVVTESGRAEVETEGASSYALKIEGNSTMVFAAVAQYLQEVLQDQNNQIELGRFVVSKAGPEYEDNYTEIVNAALNGTSLDVADACLSLIEEVSVNLGGGEDANPIIAFFSKIFAFLADLAKKIIAIFK